LLWQKLGELGGVVLTEKGSPHCQSTLFGKSAVSPHQAPTIQPHL
jgi:hypothetical protein